MLQPFSPQAAPLTRMADGTVKQINPFTGTEVWTVPGRANRPLGIVHPDPVPLRPEDDGHYCAFCHNRTWETPPEKSRFVVDPEPRIIDGRLAEDMNGPWEFRRIPNLFEILSFDYWSANYGHALPPAARVRQERYLSTEAGVRHTVDVVRQKLRAAGTPPAVIDAMSDDRLIAQSKGFFGGGHDVIVGRRHYVDGAKDSTELASSGTLTPTEHEWYFRTTVAAMRDLYDQNRYARYVAVFQNWLRPAGASFDHLHKQLVAIDERGVQAELELQKLRANPNLYNEAAVDYAGYHNLVIAENEHAVLFAGFGHRYPTLEIFSRSRASMPWDHSPEELRGMSDLVHAVHAATTAQVPCNEEWHHKPIDVDVPMPWRILVKWRVSTLAGFEGGTKIYLNTIDPWSLRDRVVTAMLELRDSGRIAPSIKIATECRCETNSLKYNPALTD